ncbi:hypothetical protein HZA33_03610, partial [Candidatus Pacearchaeota archaeon]|nr:hypothetical protein [Candidatus Pacearchaeota archaeon]
MKKNESSLERLLEIIGKILKLVDEKSNKKPNFIVRQSGDYFSVQQLSSGSSKEVINASFLYPGEEYHDRLMIKAFPEYSSAVKRILDSEGLKYNLTLVLYGDSQLDVYTEKLRKKLEDRKKQNVIMSEMLHISEHPKNKKVFLIYSTRTAKDDEVSRIVSGVRRNLREKRKETEEKMQKREIKYQVFLEKIKRLGQITEDEVLDFHFGL